jgi:hypothetical protein
MSADPARAAVLEAMARAHCRHNLECDPDERATFGPTWRLFTDEMSPLLDAVIAAAACLETVAPVLARIGRAA